MFFKITLDSAIRLEEIISEPNLRQMCLVLVGRINLFNCVEFFSTEVESLPHFTESTSS